MQFLFLSPVIRKTSSAHFSYSNLNNNKLTKITNGNGKKGLKLGFWNCRWGLVTNEKEGSYNMIEIMNFIQEQNLHMLCIIESDLHGNVSRYKGNYPLS